MRGKHKHYIDEVNKYTLPWYAKKGKKFITTRGLTFVILGGDLKEIPPYTETDLFSCVPDTGYIRFHMASLLHDELRKDPDVSRWLADASFFFEMAQAVDDIYRDLIGEGCPQKVADREAKRLARIASLYMLGVSGLIGSIYLKLDKIF